MSRIYLVRHGQASFGSHDYDRLTPAGVAQCEQLARHWQAIGRNVDLVFSGTLRRQRESAEAFARAAARAGAEAPIVRPLPGFEEYDHDALLAAHARQPATAAELEDRRDFQRRLAASLGAWTEGTLAGVETYAAFRVRCAGALARLLAEIGRGRQAILFGSAGSLAAAMQPALGVGDAELMRLKLNFHNTGVSSLLFDGATVTIECLNSIAHLEQPGFTQLITHR